MATDPRPCEDMCIVVTNGRDLLMKRADAMQYLDIVMSRAIPLMNDWDDRALRWALPVEKEPVQHTILVLTPSQCAALYLKDPKD